MKKLKESMSKQLIEDGSPIFDRLLKLLDDSYYILCVRGNHSDEEFAEYWDDMKQNIDDFVKATLDPNYEENAMNESEKKIPKGFKESEGRTPNSAKVTKVFKG